MTKWKSQRAQRERALRTSMVRRVAAGVLVAPVEHLRALLRLPCDTERDEEVRAFARKVVLDAQSEVEQCRQAEVADVAGMHMLRIAHKRLRYAVEAFSGVLPPELRAWKDVASRFQTVLGDLHDHDVATEVAQRATVMAPEVREGLLAALAAKREQIGRTYLELVGQGLAEPEHET
jgi:CHAD domain-containing protein